MFALPFQALQLQARRFSALRVLVLVAGLFAGGAVCRVQAAGPVVPGATTISAQPAGSTLLVGGSMELKLTAGGSGTLSYQWRKSSLVTTLSGSAVESGIANGVSGVSRLSAPVGVATFGGTLFVADSGNHTIRKVDLASGVASTLAGTPGMEGNLNGTLQEALFSNPFGVAVDAALNVFVADSGNHLIRKIGADGMVTTYAGKVGLAGTSDSTDGTGATARLNYPAGMVIGGDGTLYVADAGNNTIRKVDGNGGVTTLAGSAGFSGTADGTGTAAMFTNPSGLAIDVNTGNLYVADAGNSTIRKITPSGVVTTLAGSGGQIGVLDGTGSVARFFGVGGLGIDLSGNLYVGDTGNHTVRKVTASGVVSTYAGVAGKVGSTDTESGSALLQNPLGIVVDALGNVYVADTDNNTVRKIAPAVNVVNETGVSSGATLALFTKKPVGVTDTGFYDCLVTGSQGSLRSAAAYVLVNAPPRIVTQPVGSTVVTGGSVSVSTVAVGSGTLSYQWRKGGEAIKTAIKPVYSFVANTNNDSGSYDCVVTNAGGSAITTAARVVVNSTNAAIVGGSFVLPVTPQTGTVTYTSKNLPPGLTLNTLTGLLTGVPTKSGTYSVTVNTKDVSALSSNTLSFSVVVASMSPGVLGNFSGIVDRNVVLNGNLGSSVQLTTLTDGAFSGKIQTGATATPLKGQLSTSVGDTAHARAQLIVSKPGVLPVVKLDVTLDAKTNALTGTLSNGTDLASVNAWRNAWAEVPGNAAKLKGPYSFYLEQPNGDGSLPQGYGFGSFVVNEKTGVLALTGSLADGTVFSQNTFVAQGGQIPVYVSLYGDKGSFTGVLTIVKGGLAPLDNSLSGPVPVDAFPSPTWFKPVSPVIAKDLVYAAGFGPTPLTAIGGTYTAPPVGGRLLGAPAATAPVTNAALVLTAALDLTRELTVTAPAKLTLAPVAPTDPRVTFGAVDLLKGGFLGEYAEFVGTKVVRSTKFTGQVVSAGGVTKGYGFYLLPVPTDGQAVKDAVRISGRATFQSK